MHACDDKIPYASRREAAQREKGTGRRFFKGHQGRQNKPYRCPKCGAWHLGRQPSKKDPARPYFQAARKFNHRRYGWLEEVEDWSSDPLDNE